MVFDVLKPDYKTIWAWLKIPRQIVRFLRCKRAFPRLIETSPTALMTVWGKLLAAIYAIERF